ncbi:hypothetical protein IEQ11_24420 [Lysobacter capsici]|uniref:hypothetical protein n=1 Tax=Lysobacter capsici TaxID=435897 RepID=UPI00178601C1|nr:hypothetical protein [Lysobacter capsici]UOF14816.1 hypothetical protein IEQ11_24420 [Lysobacter capsici]
MAWAHHDRRLHADQLVDHGQGLIGREVGTAYLMRLLDAIASEVLDKPASLTGTSYASALRGMYHVRAEIGSTRAVPCGRLPRVARRENRVPRALENFLNTVSLGGAWRQDDAVNGRQILPMPCNRFLQAGDAGTRGVIGAGRGWSRDGRW